MLDILVIIGLCLLISSVIVVLCFAIHAIIEIFKESLMSGLMFIVLVISFVGMMCLIFAIP